jgi:hypothetical protein
MLIGPQEWNDVNLRWNSSEYGGVKDLRIPPHRIWKPDVLMYNRYAAKKMILVLLLAPTRVHEHVYMQKMFGTEHVSIVPSVCEVKADNLAIK